MSWLLLCGLSLAATLTGTVKERGTGDPLPGALIAVGELETRSNAKGAFELEVPEGTVEVMVLAGEHEPVFLSVQTPAPALEIYMLRAEAVGEIVVEARREMPHPSAQVLDRERVQKAPGTFEDPVRLLQSLPGVAVTPEYGPASGVLAVRGSAPEETRYYLDGVEIPYLFHFNNYSSVFHSRLLEDLSFFPSTFGATYGNATGAVVEARSREPDATRLHAGANINLVMVGGYLTTPVGKSGGLSVSARRSYQDARQNDQFSVWPRFYDYLARYDTDLRSPDHHLAVTFVGAGDNYSRYVFDAQEFDALEVETSPSLVFDRDFHSAAIRLHNSFGSVSSRTSVAVVWDRWAGTLPTDSQLRVSRYAWLRNDSIWSQSSVMDLAYGVELKPENVQRQATASRAWPELRDEAPLLSRGESVDESLNRVLWAGYVEPRFRVADLRMQPGLRVQGDGKGRVGVDPRLSVWWTPKEDLRIWGAAGRYSQLPSLDVLSPATGDPTLGVSQSDQASLGMDVALAGRWELGLSAWGKRFDGVILQVPGEVPRAVDGSAMGLEFSSRYRMREHFFAWTSLTLGRSERDGAPFDYDQPWSVDLVASWDFRPTWNVGVRYRLSAGLPYTAAVGGRYDADKDMYTPILGDTNGARLVNYQKVDLHIEKSWTMRNWTLVAYGEGWLVPPRNNGMYVVYSYDFSQSATVSGPVFLPLVGLRAEF